MTFHHLDSADDPRVSDYTRLTDVHLRKLREPAEGMYIAESSRVLRRALAAGHRPRSFFLAEKWLEDLGDVFAQYPDVPAYIGSAALLEDITGFHLHRGAMAAMQRPDPVPLPELLAGARRVAVLEDIVDHTNVGAIFRSAAALGVDAVLVSPRCGDPLYRRSVRVSMGTVFQVPWARLEDWPGDLQLLRGQGFTVAALELTDDAVDLDALAARRPEKLALVLGTEGAGMSPGTLAAVDLAVKIPMRAGVDSLNVAAASAVAFWELRPRD
ncbi:tRNA G18 (ribose-2'-O)-methylase SpoU [Arthrobacter ginsengisoli]|uniref:tRNA G18 (Ribose-2'-O)-methylase SpoU n=1 Tax=Arthrobacter ginsengisoli TaxID=1356565 RepID=A0ABU1U6I6_9MICC|nr:RNA methyltransferase [Arthrobacter ginsengisoli]MDR7080746.1 tRNA G18 (ribose-2'-O)-methylase SpoU [Arthrobacter ginsengisoli]